MKSPNSGFSLVELLVVMAIIMVLSAVSMVAFGSSSQGSGLSRAGQILGDHLAQARQEAVTRNRDVEVRFYYLTNGGVAGWSGVQNWRIEQTADGPVTNASTRLSLLPTGVILATNGNLSPLITASPQSGSVGLPARGNTPFRGFRFRADGAPEMAVADQNFLTVARAIDSSLVPVNYYTLQLNLLTGKVSVFRP